jgi:hypothetical protein
LGSTPPGRPPTATAPAGRGANWQTKAPRLGLATLPTCTGRKLESDLRYHDTKLYPHIAVTLATIQNSMNTAVAQIRQEYGRRPSVMKR